MRSLVWLAVVLVPCVSLGQGTFYFRNPNHLEYWYVEQAEPIDSWEYEIQQQRNRAAYEWQQQLNRDAYEWQQEQNRDAAWRSSREEQRALRGLGRSLDELRAAQDVSGTGSDDLNLSSMTWRHAGSPPQPVYGNDPLYNYKLSLARQRTEEVARTGVDPRTDDERNVDELILKTQAKIDADVQAGRAESANGPPAAALLIWDATRLRYVEVGPDVAAARQVEDAAQRQAAEEIAVAAENERKAKAMWRGEMRRQRLGR